MSDPLSRPFADDATPFESVRRDARHLLRRARAGEPLVLGAFRAGKGRSGLPEPPHRVARRVDDGPYCWPGGIVVAT